MPQITLNYANTVIKDGGVGQSVPTNNYATATTIPVGGLEGATSRWMLLKFDLGLVPNDVLINSAILQLRSQTSANPKVFAIHKVTSDWVDTVTWNTRPTFDSVPVATLTISTTATYTVDIKSLVQDWVSGGSPNYGLLLKYEVEDYDVNYLIASSEYATTAYRPQLTIDYTIPSTGKKCVEYVGSGALTAVTSTTATPEIPANAQAGDLLVLHLTVQTGATVSLPSGWAITASLGGGSNHTFIVATKFHSGSEPNPTITLSASKQINARISAFRNVKSILQTAQSSNNSNSYLTPSMTDVTTSKTDTMFAIFNSISGVVTYTPPLSYTEAYDSNSSFALQMIYKYMHDDTTQTSNEMKSTTSTNTYGASFLLVLEPITNIEPTITLTSPSDNLVLNEGNVFTIAGSATDADNGNVVTVKYKINNGPTRAIASSVSDGSSPINFSKALTYSNKRLWDGGTDVVGADLAEATTHTLYVWAEDDQGGVSVMEERDFTVVWNRPPTISGSDTNLGTINAIPTITYSATEPEGQAITITEYINGVQTKTFTATDGQEYTFEITQDQWLRLALGVPHQVKIRASDSKGLYSERVYTFTREETRIQFELNYNNQAVRDHFILDDQPTRILVTLDGTFPEGADILVEACNNALDDSPTWENITGPVLAGRGYIFQNNVKTAEQWAINIRVTIDRGTAAEPIILNGFGGAFD